MTLAYEFLLRDQIFDAGAFKLMASLEMRFSAPVMYLPLTLKTPQPRTSSRPTLPSSSTQRFTDRLKVLLNRRPTILGNRKPAPKLSHAQKLRLYSLARRTSPSRKLTPTYTLRPGAFTVG